MSDSLSQGLAAYRKVFLIRSAEEAILRHYGEDEMKTPMHMSMGQEAISAGVCLALGDRGRIFASYRSHAAFLAQTEDVDAFFAELYGKVSGPGQGKGGSMHLSLPEKGHMCSSAIVASCLPLAVGAAYAFRSRREDLISCVFFGDGALDEGAFWESINTACVMRLSVLFVCEDNDWAVHTARHARAGYDSIVAVLGKMRCLVAEADSSDAEEIARITQELLSEAHAQSRPVFLKLKCCRYLEHVGISRELDAPYRSQAEVRSWQARDAVVGQRERLLQRGVAEAALLELENQVRRKIEVAVADAMAAPLPAIQDLWKDVL